MANQKIFAGARIRRIRMGKGLTQTAMAEGLGISPSYLNLIERNQRPLTVPLILKLASVYKIDADELQGEGDVSLAALREIFADPLLVGELPGEQELVELAEAAPNAAAALIKLYRAYREQTERLSDLSALLAQEGRSMSISATRLPSDAVREAFERRPHHFDDIEREAETFHKHLDPRDDLAGALKSWLRSEHGITVRVLPVATMPNWRRRYDRHSQRLFISERLSPADQLREIAFEVCQLRMSVVIGAEIERLGLSGNEQKRLARFELGRYAAHALMMPYRRFLEAAERARYDLDLLRARFGVSFEQAANRLTTLARPQASGVPFFLLEIDHAGNRIRRAGAQGFPQARFGGGCPKLNMHEAFSQPGRIMIETVEMPDGTSFLTLARTLEGPQGAFMDRPRRTALLLGCETNHAEKLVYSAALPAGTGTPVGAACRLCERTGCLARAAPPVTRPLGLDEMVSGLSAFDFQ